MVISRRVNSASHLIVSNERRSSFHSAIHSHLSLFCLTFTYLAPLPLASSNRCFTAALTWQHGTFTNNANGSLSLTPYAPDGYVQVMDPCAAQSTQIYSYNQCVQFAVPMPSRTFVPPRRSSLADPLHIPPSLPRRFELIPQWFNYLESSTGYANIAGSAYAMKMFEDDGTGTAGTPKAIMYLINRPPTMLPTVQLHEEVLNSVGAYD